jgi:hypothetical protein
MYYWGWRVSGSRGLFMFADDSTVVVVLALRVLNCALRK